MVENSHLGITLGRPPAKPVLKRYMAVNKPACSCLLTSLERAEPPTAHGNSLVTNLYQCFSVLFFLIPKVFLQKKNL